MKSLSLLGLMAASVDAMRAPPLPSQQGRGHAGHFNPRGHPPPRQTPAAANEGGFVDPRSNNMRDDFRAPPNYDPYNVHEGGYERNRGGFAYGDYPRDVYDGDFNDSDGYYDDVEQFDGRGNGSRWPESRRQPQGGARHGHPQGPPRRGGADNFQQQAVRQRQQQGWAQQQQQQPWQQPNGWSNQAVSPQPKAPASPFFSLPLGGSIFVFVAAGVGFWFLLNFLFP